MFGFDPQRQQLEVNGPTAIDWILEVSRRPDQTEDVTTIEEMTLDSVGEAPSDIPEENANEAFLIQGSLTRGLEEPALERGPVGEDDAIRHATAIQQGFWGGAPAAEGVEPVTPIPGVAKPKKTRARRPAPRRPLRRAPNRFGNRRRTQVVQGSAYFTVRNAAFDARPFSLSGQLLPKPSYAQNRFGFTAGGPLRIPKVWQREGTSFYFNYSGSRAHNPYSALITLPSPLERSGDFSQSVTRTPVTIYDPTTGAPFPGNSIPRSRAHPASAGLLEFIPAPNQPGRVQNYHYLASIGTDTDNFGFRLQQALSKRDRLAFSINRQLRSGQQSHPYGYRGETQGGGLNTDLTWRHGFGPKAVSEFRANLNRNRNETVPYFAFKENVAGRLGITGTSQEPINWGPPNVSFTNFGGLSDASPILRRDQGAGIREGLTYVAGKHNFTFGGEYRRNQINSRTDQNARGSMSFSGLNTSGFDARGYPLLGTGFDFADFLLGLPQSSSIRFGSANTYFREQVYSTWVQDDYRLRPNLTVNIGIRYEYFTPYQEKFGRMANLDLASGFTGAAVVTAGGEGPFTGKFAPGLVDPDKNNWSPRIGLAWKPGKQTVVRGGYGLYYNGSIYGQFATRLASQPPFANTGTQTTSASYRLSIDDAFATAPTQKITNTYAVNRFYEVGYAQTWNLGVQRELPNALVIELGYLGTKGTHLDIQRLPNRAAPGSPLTAEQRRLIGNAVGFTFQSSEGNSIYHAGQVRLIRRFRKGMSANVLYTFSKSIDNASTFGGGGNVVAQFDRDLHLERGLSSFDQRHALQANFYLATPQRGGAMFKNWTLSGGVALRSGTPFTARVLGNRADSGGTGVVGSGRAEATGEAVSGGRFFNLNAFGLPPSGRYGNAGRNTIPGQRFFGLNVQFGRSFRVGDGRRWLDLRLDANNLTNSVSYTGLATVVNSLNYGLPTATAPMRTLNGTVRFRF
jgi:hypothetical protein